MAYKFITKPANLTNYKKILKKEFTNVNSRSYNLGRIHRIYVNI